MTRWERWRTGAAGGWLACGLLAALFLAPSLRAGAFGPADLLLSMTPWSLYADRFPEVHGVHNPQLDVIQQYVPWRIYASQTLRQGILPLWNPHAYCGQPFVANVLSAVFYPFCWLALAMPIGAFFLLSAWFHLTLLGGGMWLLLRSLDLRPSAALGGAAVMMLNTFVIGWLAYPNLSQWTYAWAPLLLFGWHRAFLRRAPVALIGPTLVLALVAVGGHVQIALYVGLGWVIFAVAEIARARRWRDLWVYVALPAAFAGGLAGLQLLPAFELARLSGRTGQSYADAIATRLPASMLGVVLMPWFYGHNALHLALPGPGGQPLPVSYWGPYNNAIEASVSAGAAAFWLAVIALRRRRGALVWAFGAMALIGLLMALGTPLYWLFFKLIPGVSSLRGLSRAFALVNLGLAGLTGFGIEALAERREGSRLPAALLLGTVTIILLAMIGEVVRVGIGTLTALTPGLGGYVVKQAGLAVGVAVLLALALGRPTWTRWIWLVPTVELFLLGFGLHRGGPPDLFFFPTPETELLAEIEQPYRLVGVPAPGRPAFLDWMPMNTPMAYGLSSPCGSESLSFDAYRQVLTRFWDQDSFTPDLNHPLLHLLGVRYLLSRADLAGGNGLRRVGGERVGVYENPQALPLIFVTARWHRGDARMLDRLLSTPGYDPREVVIDPVAPPPVLSTGAAASWYAQFPTPQRAVARGPSDGSRLVVWTSVRGPGWSAWTEREPAQIWTADTVFQAVQVNGERDVRWVYRPMGFQLGLFLSLCAAMGLAMVVMTGRRSEHHERAAARQTDP